MKNKKAFTVFNGINILHLEDSETDHLSLKWKIGKTRICGANIVRAENLKEAYAQLCRKDITFHLAVIDLNLSGDEDTDYSKDIVDRLEGFRLLEYCVSKGIPNFVFTGEIDEEVFETASLMGANKLYIKGDYSAIEKGVKDCWTAICNSFVNDFCENKFYIKDKFFRKSLFNFLVDFEDNRSAYIFGENTDDVALFYERLANLVGFDHLDWDASSDVVLGRSEDRNKKTILKVRNLPSVSEVQAKYFKERAFKDGFLPVFLTRYSPSDLLRKRGDDVSFIDFGQGTHVIYIPPLSKREDDIFSFVEKTAGKKGDVYSKTGAFFVKCRYMNVAEFEKVVSAISLQLHNGSFVDLDQVKFPQTKEAEDFTLGLIDYEKSVRYIDRFGINAYLKEIKKSIAGRMYDEHEGAFTKVTEILQISKSTLAAIINEREKNEHKNRAS